VDELAAEVANASNEQTQGIVQINAAVGEMDKVTQANAAAAEESAAAAEELNSQAAMTRQAVGELVRLIQGADLAPAARRPKPPSKPGPAKPRPPAGARPTNGSPPAARRAEIPLEQEFKDF
jgi:methyl-accepting chemotaxis protein